MAQLANRRAEVPREAPLLLAEAVETRSKWTALKCQRSVGRQCFNPTNSFSHSGSYKQVVPYGQFREFGGLF
jgi:hypothetical protein